LINIENLGKIPVQTTDSNIIVDDKPSTVQSKKDVIVIQKVSQNQTSTNVIPQS